MSERNSIVSTTGEEPEISCKRVCALFLLAAMTAVASSAQTYRVLYTFTGGSDGAYPAYGGLVPDGAGNFYGAATFGGDVTCPVPPSTLLPGPGCGVVFKFNLATKQETVLYTFAGEADGSNPWSGVIRDAKGNLYGTAPFGGTNGVGVIFRVTSSGKETVLHTFNSTDGANPTGGLLLDTSGNLYGTVVSGGDLNRCAGLGCGVVFKESASGLSLLHAFTGPGKGDGANPTHAMIRDAAGNLYGTTENGGISSCTNVESFEPVETFVAGCGTIFKLDPRGTETPSYRFNVSPDGSDPRTTLTEDTAGNFYGTTFYGGLYGAGTVFKVDSAGQETILYNFQGLTDGANPWSGLVQDAAGNLYGTTNHAGGGGACYCGTVFKLDPSGNYTVLHSFDFADGAYPTEPLLLYGGALYGITSNGGTLSNGSSGTGVIFEITP